MEILGQTYLSEILHAIAQAALLPVVALLLLFILYSLFEIGSLLCELFSTRRHFKVDMPRFLAAIQKAAPHEVPAVVTESGLINRQKIALLTQWDFRLLNEDGYLALAKRLLANESLRYDRIAGRVETAAKLAPMLGLMGTLIPLGPGIVALGQKGDVTTLASSIGIAFDTTVAGLIAAFICFIIAKIRRNWYKNYMVALESGITAIIAKAQDMQAAGRMDIAEPGTSAQEYAAQVGAKMDDRNHARELAQEAAQAQTQAGAGSGAGDACAADAGTDGADARDGSADGEVRAAAAGIPAYTVRGE